MADRGVIRPWVKVMLGVVLVLALLGVGLLLGVRAIERRWQPDPETIAASSLAGLREQNRLSAFVASYVAVVTSTQRRFGLSAQRTLIMPGLVRYEVDLAKLRQGDLRWDAAASRLDVTLPPLEVVGPQVDLTRIREYDSGGLLMRLTDAGDVLDAANRRAGQTDLLAQAHQTVPMTLARDATRRAIERSFALPLRAAGLTATVRVRFPDEPGFRDDAPELVDGSRSPAEVYRNGVR